MSNQQNGWPIVPLGSLLTDIQPGFASGKHNSSGEGVPHFRPMNVSVDGGIERTVLKYVDPSAGRPDLRLCSGDVLFNNTNSPELVGKTALFQGDDAPAFSNHMTRLRVDASRLEPGFLALRLHQAWRTGWFAEHCNNHVSQASIGRDVLRTFAIELPPLNVQREIASLARAIDDKKTSSRAHLSDARRAIERFRQAVLASACVGRLTADWRDTHADPATVEAALVERAGSKKKRTTREQSVDLDLPELPAGYLVGTVGDAAQVIDYGTSRRADADPDSGVPVLRMGNIQDGRLDTNDLKYMIVDKEIEGLLLRDGDLLFNRTNSPELVGKSAVYRGDSPTTFASYLIRVRFHPDVAEPEFANLWINSAWGRAWASLARTDGVSQSNINGSKLALMGIPFPPIEEQRVIIERAGQLLATADRLMHQVDAAATKVDRSSQAALAKAFRGERIGDGGGV